MPALAQTLPGGSGSRADVGADAGGDPIALLLRGPLLLMGRTMGLWALRWMPLLPFLLAVSC